MNDIEIVVFNDKSWVRLTEYQKLKEENRQLKQQTEKMKCCGNCKYCDNDNPCFFHKEYRQCVDYSSWKLAE